MDIAYPHIAERLFGRPHAIEPEALRAIIESPLAKRIISGEPFTSKAGKKGRNVRRDRLAAVASAEEVRSNDGIINYGLTADGIAIVPIAGVLSRRFDWLASACGFTTYDGLGATLADIQDNFRVRGVLLDVDSPGGEAAGMLDIADAILAARDKTPVWAVANTLAASAAYALAGSAETLYLPRLAQVGSIGCAIIHVDQTASDKASGLAYTAIFSGSRKMDGWGHAPLSEAARSSAQADADHVREQFAALVGRQGRMSAQSAMATEAEVYSDNSAIEAGLADRIGTFSDALTALTEKVSSNKGVQIMTKAAAKVETEAPIAEAPKAAQEEFTSVYMPGVVTVSSLVPHAEMTPPKAGETCALCSQTVPLETAGAPAPAATAEAPAYGQAEIEETIAACKAARMPEKIAEFVSARTPVASVRNQLLETLAAAADAKTIAAVGTSSDPSNDAILAQKRAVQAKLKAEGVLGHR